MNRHVVMAPRWNRPIPQIEEAVAPVYESSSEEEITVEVIIRDKPDVKVVRAYFKEAVAGIEDD